MSFPLLLSVTYDLLDRGLRLAHVSREQIGGYADRALAWAENATPRF
jgi:hypothetical protein